MRRYVALHRGRIMEEIKQEHPSAPYEQRENMLRLRGRLEFNALPVAQQRSLLSEMELLDPRERPRDSKGSFRPVPSPSPSPSPSPPPSPSPIQVTFAKTRGGAGRRGPGGRFRTAVSRGAPGSTDARAGSWWAMGQFEPFRGW